MKFYLFAITILCFISTGFNSRVDAQDDFNYGHLKERQSLSTDLAQNVNSNPQSAEDYFNRGINYGESGQKEKALADFNQAIKLNSNYTQTYYNRLKDLWLF